MFMNNYLRIHENNKSLLFKRKKVVTQFGYNIHILFLLCVFTRIQIDIDDYL